MALASSIPPSPPFAHTWDKATLTPNSLHLSLTKFISASVSVGNSFIATTAGNLNTWVIFSTCFNKFGRPASKASLEGTPAFVHGGPFANIAHGCNSVIATRSW